MNNHDEDYEPPLDFEDENAPRGRRGSHRGSTTNVRDSRFSKLIGWGLGALGAAFVTGVWLAANNLYQLNLSVVRGIDRDVASDVRLNDHEARLRSVEKDLILVEGKTFRGVVGMDPKIDAKEKPRGR